MDEDMAGPRILPLPPAEWTGDARAILGFWSGPDEMSGDQSNLMLTLANHPALALAVLTLGDHLLFRSTLPHRLREIVTLRVAWTSRSEHEWAWHALYARDQGMTNAELAAIKMGAAAECWTSLERALIEAVDQLRGDGAIAAGTEAVLAAMLDTRQRMDLIFTVGHYTALSWASAALRIAPQEGDDASAGFALPPDELPPLTWGPGRTTGS
ncbi:MAG: carboxymuconolactone decarboxylase family protein [Sphingomonas sp.]